MESDKFAEETQFKEENFLPKTIEVVNKELAEKQQKADEILKELKKARFEEQQYCEESIQKVVCDFLNIPDESSDISIAEAIKKVEEYRKIIRKFQGSNCLSESDLLTKCSGGKALEGVLCKKQFPNHLDAAHCRLLEVPQNVVITRLSKTKSNMVECLSNDEEKQFKEFVEVFGHSASVSLKFPLKGNSALSLGASHSQRTEDESTYNKQTDIMNSSTVEYICVKVASFTFERKDLKLTEDAQAELREILKMLKTGVGTWRVHKACENFLEQYGSHIYKGPLDFGGILWRTWSSEKFSEIEVDTKKTMLKQALSSTLGASVAPFIDISGSTSIDTSKGLYKGEGFHNTLLVKTLKVDMTGGPLGIKDFDLWMSGLVSNNDTWILTDRGRNLIAVWEIIKLNHEKELGGVRNVLKTTWEEITGLTAQPDHFTSLSHEPNIILKEVSEWIENANKSPEQIEKFLKYLLKVRRETVTEANTTFWITDFILQPAMQKFFLMIIELNPQLDRIRFLMQQLIDQIDFLKLPSINYKHLDCIERVSGWLKEHSQLTNLETVAVCKEITDFESFTDFLKDTLDDARIASSNANYSEAKVTKDVSRAISQLRCHYKHTHDDVLIVAIVSSFQSEIGGDITTLTLDSFKDLESLYDLLSSERKKFLHYQKTKALNLQAYLLSLATEHCPEENVCLLLQHLKQMIDLLEPSLNPKLANELDSYFQGFNNLRTLKQTLRTLMTTAPECTPKPMTLVNILKTPTQSQKMLSKCPLSGNQGNPKVRALFERLGLHNEYPKGLHLEDALRIKRDLIKLSIEKIPVTDPQKIPHLILYKLMSYDSLCRSDLIPAIEEDDESEIENAESEVESDESEVESDQESSCSETSDDLQLSSKASGFHPVDCLLSLIICSDDFLRQDLFSRLAKCQLAVPFILPDPFTKQLTLPLWCLRSIIKEWNSTKGGGKIMQKIQPVISNGMPIVTFIRIGKHHEHVNSKSAILNEVISDSHYDHFFHRDCPGGFHELVLGDGLVDMCWYLPGKTATAFPESVTFLNLHGDAREHPQQMRFLSQISSMCFVLLTEKSLKLDDDTKEILKKSSSFAGCIFVLSRTRNMPKYLKQKAFIDLKHKNIHDIKDTIRKRINKHLDFSGSFRSIEDYCHPPEKIVFVDEHGESCKQGLAHAAKIKTLITNYRPKQKAKLDHGLKAMYLPLQGELLWRTWATNNKEMFRQIHRGNKSVNQYADDIKREKAAIRREQLERIKSLEPLMESFIISLLTFGGDFNKTSRHYFLHHLKLELDNICRKKLSHLHNQYKLEQEELSKLEENQESKSRVEVVRKNIACIQEAIIRESFGLEHFFRELGQVYEAAYFESQLTTRSLYGESLRRLPKAAAEILIDGYPLELMDGDAAHVPLQWVTAVLEETTKKLGDPNVFVLSVLGLQSSGKSTLLNAVFGLQFKVSSGRCTRGAFMQLLPLNDENINYSYVLVVDTEGLRAPVLNLEERKEHDNELATFVIGLADMTLINIKGETPGDMDDFLQITVYAFLRMTQVDLSPSCLFVHQNANSSRSEVQHDVFIDKLNKFTIEAAKHEHCEEKFKRFNDVIKCDYKGQVHYFPVFLSGDPPMAPIDRSYTQHAQELKLQLIEEIMQTDNFSEETTSEHSFSSFKVKLKNLWESLLKENFLFSFKNAIEIVAYDLLEAEYSKWDWKLHTVIQKWEHASQNSITAQKTVAGAFTQANKRRAQLHDDMATVYKKLEEEMTKFFGGDHSKVLVQWKAKFQNKISTLKEELEAQARLYCLTLAKSKEANSQFEQEQKIWTSKITREVQAHISSLKKEQEQFSKLSREKKLTEQQLKIICDRKIFTLESLTMYSDQAIITPDQAKAVKAIINECSGNLTRTELKKILFGDDLGWEQIKRILTMRRQTKEELELKFKEIWDEFIMQIPHVPRATLNVENEVQEQLISFVPKLETRELLDKIKKKKEDLQDARLELTSIENIHYYREMTEKVFDCARKCLADIEKQNICFRATHAKILFHTVDNSIKEESTNNKLSITPEYKNEMFLVVCRYAIPRFEKMNKFYVEQIDHRSYLEKRMKTTLLERFMCEYHQSEAEVVIANTLCALLEEPIKDQIRATIGALMAGKMRATTYHFSSKMALKVKVLVDLKNQNDFNGYMTYVGNIRMFLQNRIEQYTIQYANEKIHGQTRLQLTMKEEVSRLIDVIESAVTEVNKSDIQEWLTTFSENQMLVSELGNIDVDTLWIGFDSVHKINVDNFKKQIRNGLQKVKTSLHATYSNIEYGKSMTQWKDKPHNLLACLIGCPEQCPFCGEQCDLQDPNHYIENNHKHRSVVHRPACLAGTKQNETDKLETDFCTSFISSEKNFQSSRTGEAFHPFKQYESIYPEWSIPPDPSTESCLYWKWFVGKYSRELARKYNSKQPDVPQGWHNIKWCEVANSLQEAYKVTV